MTAKLRPRAKGVRFLARDSFLVDAVGVVGTRAATPGPGTLTTTDTNARMSISGGALVQNGALNVADVLHYTSTYTVAPGLAMGMIWKTLSIDSGYYGFGWRTDSPQYGVNIRAGGGANFRLYSSTNSLVITPSLTSAPHKLAIVLRTTGSYVLNRAATGWRVIFPMPWSVQSPVYARGVWMSGNNGTNEFDLMSVAQLGGQWASARGIDTRYSGAVAEGTAITHAADTWLQFTLTTLPSSGSIILEFRRQDSDNCWRVSISSGGSLTLDEVVAGVATLRGTGSVSSGNIVTIRADGSDYAMYHDVTSRFTASRSTWNTLAGGTLVSLGTGGVITNLDVIPVAVPAKEGRMLDRLVS